MLKKTAIVTLYGEHNIGNKLQNYAVQRLCEQYSENVTTLTYRGIPNELNWKGKIVALFGFPRQKSKEKRLMIKRIKRFKLFSEKYLHTERPMHLNKFNYLLGKKYDAFVVGSDQVWHNWTKTKEELRYFFLEFTDEKKRICLSPSFGFDKMEDVFYDNYKTGLSGFRFLSCREGTGCTLIENLIHKEVELLIDPTMVLSEKDWDRIMVKPQFDIPDRYILVYSLGGLSQQGNLYLKHISEKYNLKIIDILNLKYPEYYLTTPDEFLYLVKNAFYVVTNSFHGSALTIIYHKNFSVFPRTDRSGLRMGARINTLLEKFGLAERFSFVGNPMDEVNYNNVESILKREREKVVQYLNNAFSYVSE